MKNIKKTTLIGLSSLALALGMMAGPALADGGHRGHGEGRHYRYSNDDRGRGDRHYRYYRGDDGRRYRYYRDSDSRNRESNMNYSGYNMSESWHHRGEGGK